MTAREIAKKIVIWNTSVSFEKTTVEQERTNLRGFQVTAKAMGLDCFSTDELDEAAEIITKTINEMLEEEPGDRG